MLRYLDLLRDPRLPHLLPWALWRRWSRAPLCRRSLREIPGPVCCAVTLDLEQDDGSLGTPEQARAVRPFLDMVADGRFAGGAPMTLFVQADLLGRDRSLGPVLAALAARHEIGLHGYRHSLWGGRRWYLPHQPMSPVAKREDLGHALDLFREAKLPEPLSFRAPDMVADADTLGLLAAAGFMVDSSLASYRAGNPVPTPLTADLIEIPVTADPLPAFRLRAGVIPVAEWRVFNLCNLLWMTEQDLDNYAARVLSFQIARGVQPHLVFLAHPWEFTDGISRLGYASSANVGRLTRAMEQLQSRVPLQFVRMSDLARTIKAGSISGTVSGR